MKWKNKWMYIGLVIFFTIIAICPPAMADGVSVTYNNDGTATISVAKVDADRLIKMGGDLHSLHITGIFTGRQIAPMEKQADGSFTYLVPKGFAGHKLIFAITSGKGEAPTEYWLPERSEDFLAMVAAGRAGPHDGNGANYIFGE